MKIKHFLVTFSLTFLSTIAWKISHIKPIPMVFPNNQAFAVLSGWETANLKPSLLAFRNSCHVFLHQNPEQNVGNARFRLKAKDWQPLCSAAMNVNPDSKYGLRTFFQTWFKPVAVNGKTPTKGTFTGYYAATIPGSRSKTTQYPLPLHDDGRPQSVLAWVASAKDISTLVMEGSAVIQFADGSHLAIEYVTGNRANPYFKVTKDHAFHGAQDVTLTPGYSLAIDRRWIPLGTPLWLTTQVRQDFSKQAPPFKRLMIAQDIGNAIRGAVRGDLYWGPGSKATKIANNLKSQGSYWLLLPINVKVHSPA